MEELPDDDGGRLFSPPPEHPGPDEGRTPPPIRETEAASAPVVGEASQDREPVERPLFPSADRGPAGSLFAPPHTTSRRAATPAAPPAEAGRTGRSIHLGGGPPPFAPPSPASQHGGPPPGPPPPPMGPPPSGPAGGHAVPATQRTPGNRLVGQVEGEVQVAVDSRGLRGVRVLAVAAVLAAQFRTAEWGLRTRAELPQLGNELVVALLVVLALLVLISWGFGVSPAALLRALAADRADGGVRARLGELRGRDPGWPRTSVAVVRFRLRGITGELIPCVLRGAAHGQEIRAGEYLLVEGRRRRTGDVVVRRVEVLQGPAGPQLRVLERRPTSRSVGVTVVDWLCLAAGLALFLWAVAGR